MEGKRDSFKHTVVQQNNTPCSPHLLRAHTHSIHTHTHHTLAHILSPQDMLQYRKKLRPLRVRTLDSSIKTLLVDDSQTAGELIRTVCARIGKDEQLEGREGG